VSAAGQPLKSEKQFDGSRLQSIILIFQRPSLESFFYLRASVSYVRQPRASSMARRKAPVDDAVRKSSST
jgi:hypothetical protein